MYYTLVQVFNEILSSQKNGHYENDSSTEKCLCIGKKLDSKFVLLQWLQSCKMPKHDKLKLNTIFMRLAMVWGNGVLFAEQFGSIRIVNKYMLWLVLLRISNEIMTSCAQDIHIRMFFIVYDSENLEML